MFEELTYYSPKVETTDSKKSKSFLYRFSAEQLNIILILACTVMVGSLIIGFFLLRSVDQQNAQTTKDKTPTEVGKEVKP
jgi:flagellar basal body-associated protein FliL